MSVTSEVLVPDIRYTVYKREQEIQGRSLMWNSVLVISCMIIYVTATILT
jgi:hypothetical protein